MKFILNFNRLEKNIIDMITEQQIKLGYRKETIRLYYPLVSLNHFISSDLNIEQMRLELNNFFSSVQQKYGEVIISNRGDRFCLQFSPVTSEYVHENMDDQSFIKELIYAVQEHQSTIDDILKLFQKYSDCVHFEEVKNGEFDYLVYFENGEPDDYMYCIKDEEGHITYHRFTLDDFEDFNF
ncbi:MAG: DUF3877 family protein [Lachnospiraceae bacterium]|nr:DUF3877 family protein [Lachnospiraceae bacterium]